MSCNCKDSVYQRWSRLWQVCCATCTYLCYHWWFRWRTPNIPLTPGMSKLVTSSASLAFHIQPQVIWRGKQTTHYGWAFSWGLPCSSSISCLICKETLWWSGWSITLSDWAVLQWTWQRNTTMWTDRDRTHAIYHSGESRNPCSWQSNVSVAGNCLEQPLVTLNVFTYPDSFMIAI